jgi:hypothetical protein
MFTVILPTMWRGEELSEMLPRVTSHSLVGEIILIDNEPSGKPDWFEMHPKITYLPQEQNIYVNPAWNLGAKLAKHDQLCFWSDDTLFHECVFDELNDKLSSNDGITGLNPPEIVVRKPDEPVSRFVSQILPSKIEVKPTDIELCPLGFSMLYFINRANYIPIPAELKIYFGEVWLYYISQMLGKKPRLLHNYKMITKPYSTSLRDEKLRALKWDDNAIAKQIIESGLQKLWSQLNGS